MTYQFDTSVPAEEVAAAEPVVHKRKGLAALLDKLAALVLFATVFLLPFFGMPLSGLPIAFSKIALLAVGTSVALSLWLIGRMEDGQMSLPRNWLFGLLFLFLVVTLASALTSGTIWNSLTGYGNEADTLINLATLFFLGVLSYVYITSEKLVNRVLSLLSVSFVITMLLQLVHLFGVDIGFIGLSGVKATAIIGKWNDLAVFSGLMMMVAMLRLQFAEQLNAKKWLSLLMLVLGLIGLAITNYQPVLFSVAILSFGMLVYTMVLSVKGGEGKGALIGILVFVMLVSAGFAFWTDKLGNYLANRAITSLEVRPAWGATLAVAKSALADDLLLGVGPNNFALAWLSNKPAGVNVTPFWSIDFSSGVGRIPSFLVTTGLLGVITWALFLVFLLYYGLRVFTARDVTMSHWVELLVVYLSVLYLTIFSIIYVTDIALWALLFVLLGVLSSSLAENDLTKKMKLALLRDAKVGFVSILILIVLLIGGATTGFASVQKVRSFASFKSGIDDFQRTGDLAKAEAAVSAANSQSEQDVYYRGLSEVNLLRVAEVVRKTGESPEALRNQFATYFSSAVSSAQKAVAINPKSYLNHLALAKVYETVVPLKIPGAYEKAVESYDNAKKLNPQSPAILLSQAKLELANGSRSKTRELAKQSLVLKENYTEALFFLSQLDADDGQIKSAIKNAEQAAFLAPDDVGVFFQLGLLKYMNKDYVGAVPALERAVQLNLAYANARYFLGLSYDKLGRRSDALAQFAEIQKTNAGNAEVKKIIENLNAGRSALSDANVQPEKRTKLPVQE